MELRVLHTSPNVCTIDNFLTQEEIRHLNSLCTYSHAMNRFQRSYTQKDNDERVISNYRTSTFITPSLHDNVCNDIKRRSAYIIGNSIDDIEPLQIVSYHKGQSFGLHHDSGTITPEGLVELSYPIRVCTFFIVSCFIHANSFSISMT